MKLIQHAFLLPKFEFTLQERVVQVKRSTLSSSVTFEIPFADIDPRPSEQESRGVGWYFIGSALAVLGVVVLDMAFTRATGDDRLGLVVGAFLAGCTALLCLAMGRRETFSQLTFHSVRSGCALIQLRHQVPASIHIREFVEILTEKIGAEPDGSKDFRDNWRG